MQRVGAQREVRIGSGCVRVAAAILVLCAAEPARAAEPRDCSESPDVEVRYRRAFTALEQGTSSARLWWISWTAGYSAATLGQGALAVATRDRGTRIDSIVGGAEAAVGIIGMFAGAPRTPMWAADELSSMDDRTACARAQRLARAEELLRKSAAEERLGRSWYAQLLGGVLNLAAPAVLWFGYHRFASGWYTLGPGIAVQEGQILTQPTAAIETWRSYRASFHSSEPVTWTVTPVVGGIAVVGAF